MKDLRDMLRRTKATAIPQKVKDAVYKRDKEHCINCGRYAYRSWACAHWVNRAQGGLGIEENILTLCPECHRRYDEGSERAQLKERFRRYLSKCYGKEITEKAVTYNKWGIFDD